MSITGIQEYQNDPDTLEFLQLLRDNLVEHYGTILVAIGESSLHLNNFKPHLPFICDFLEQVVIIDGVRDFNKVQQIASLILDMAT